ncbi:unnamed protein product [Adineta steineri]|uniref:Uncharacterized protein n=1 Tax=Adineta steineri TaxID=433720 RepID=A0A815SHZ1_9BILA|nr:unnamed protein product [Adineta steineri]CAF1490382.1 unnamed protein product [Adineta steineri]CAF3911130.1 unnamed protein product [Adineta steineri]CAF4180518.1 unnamed protein product [Adineta steineri]
MNGRSTIIVMLQCYFQATENKIPRFKGVCDLLLGGLVDGNYEITPRFDDLVAEVTALALVFLPGNHRNLPTIQEDLWTLLVNWWNTARWARREVRIFAEKDDLLADLLTDIVNKILIHNNLNVRENYTFYVLQALIQMTTFGRITNTYFRPSLPTEDILNNILQEYRVLSHHYGFDNNNVHILLQLLCNKKNRNTNSHADYKVKEYKLYCERSQIQPSYYGYISYRGLNIPQEHLNACQHLFLSKYGI